MRKPLGFVGVLQIIAAIAIPNWIVVRIFTTFFPLVYLGYLVGICVVVIAIFAIIDKMRDDKYWRQRKEAAADL